MDFVKISYRPIVTVVGAVVGEVVGAVIAAVVSAVVSEVYQMPSDIGLVTMGSLYIKSCIDFHMVTLKLTVDDLSMSKWPKKLKTTQ